MPEIVSVTAIAMAAYCLSKQSRRSSNAVSEEAIYAGSQVTQVWVSLDQQISIQGRNHEIIADIDDLASEHASPGWDGDMAQPVPYSTVLNAKNFINALPEQLPKPELAVDPDDSSISFEWYNGHRRVFSVSVGESGRLACAGIAGPDRWHAALDFDGDKMPELVIHSIKQILG